VAKLSLPISSSREIVFICMICIVYLFGADTFMRSRNHHGTNAAMEDSLVLDSSLGEIQPDEAVPLLRQSCVPLSHQNFEMASVHKSNQRHVCVSNTLTVSGLRSSSRFSGINPSLDMDAELCYFCTPNRGRFFLHFFI